MARLHGVCKPMSATVRLTLVCWVPSSEYFRCSAEDPLSVRYPFLASQRACPPGTKNQTFDQKSRLDFAFLASPFPPAPAFASCCASRSPSTGGKLNGFTVNVLLDNVKVQSSSYPALPLPRSWRIGSLWMRRRPCGGSLSSAEVLLAEDG